LTVSCSCAEVWASIAGKYLCEQLNCRDKKQIVISVVKIETDGMSLDTVNAATRPGEKLRRDEAGFETHQPFRNIT
jgi:hypothetical protein